MSASTEVQARAASAATRAPIQCEPLMVLPEYTTGANRLPPSRRARRRCRVRRPERTAGAGQLLSATKLSAVSNLRPPLRGPRARVGQCCRMSGARVAGLAGRPFSVSAPVLPLRRPAEVTGSQWHRTLDPSGQRTELFVSLRLAAAGLGSRLLATRPGAPRRQAQARGPGVLRRAAEVLHGRNAAPRALACDTVTPSLD